LNLRQKKTVILNIQTLNHVIRKEIILFRNKMLTNGNDVENEYRSLICKVIYLGSGRLRPIIIYFFIK
jgi:hypothetical protein